MDQNKNQGQQKQRQPNQSQPDAFRQDGQGWTGGSNNPNRDQAEGERDEGTASYSPNQSGAGISNRGMKRELSEQAELPDRGTSKSDNGD
jgi:hypothetical protein